MKYIIEIVKLNGTGQAQVLLSFTHTASSMQIVRETMKAVQDSTEWPAEANGFRILSESSEEICAWP